MSNILVPSPQWANVIAEDAVDLVSGRYRKRVMSTEGPNESDEARLKRIDEILNPRTPGYSAELLTIEDSRFLFQRVLRRG